MKWKFSALILIVLITASAVWWQSSRSTAEATRSSQIAPTSAPELKDHIRSLQTPVVLVNFWASWCTPCKVEFPALLALREKMANQGLKVVFVSIDEIPELPAAEEFLRQQGVQFQTFYKGEQPAGFIKDLFPDWQGSVPVSLLFSPDLKLIDAWEGDASAKELEERVSRHLKVKGT